MSLQDLTNTVTIPLELNLQLTTPLLAQKSSSSVLQRNLGEIPKMHFKEWYIPQPPMLSGVSAELVHRDLWQKFHKLTTEMIITKGGRRMYPSIKVNLTGLQELENYYVLLEIAPASDQRQKYCGYDSSKNNYGGVGWTSAGPADPQYPFQRRVYMYPDSPRTGRHWMDNPINFEKLKLTNNPHDIKDHMILTSMHKYIPKIWVIRCMGAKTLSELFANPAALFIFEETQFIAVTAYQNENITKLKIDNNPFAKGFRETGRSRYKRKYQQIDQQSSDSTNDERSLSRSVSTSDESILVSSDRSSVVSNAESSSLSEESAKRLAVESSTHHDARGNVARSIAANPPVAIVANPRLNDENDNNEVSFHRPWLDPPRLNIQPVRPSLNNNRSSLFHQYGNTRYTDHLQNYVRYHDYWDALNNCYYASGLVWYPLM